MKIGLIGVIELSLSQEWRFAKDCEHILPTQPGPWYHQITGLYLKGGKFMSSSIFSNDVASFPSTVDWKDFTMTETMKTTVMQGKKANMSGIVRLV